MDIAITLFIVLLFVLWLWAEFRGNRWFRISTGCILVVYTVFLTHFISGIMPKYEISAVKSSMQKASTLFADGQAARVNDAITAYNTEAKEGRTYKAAFEMWYVLNHGPRKPE